MCHKSFAEASSLSPSVSWDRQKLIIRYTNVSVSLCDCQDFGCLGVTEYWIFYLHEIDGWLWYQTVTVVIWQCRIVLSCFIWAALFRPASPRLASQSHLFSASEGVKHGWLLSWWAVLLSPHSNSCATVGKRTIILICLSSSVCLNLTGRAAHASKDDRGRKNDLCGSANPVVSSVSLNQLFWMSSHVYLHVWRVCSSWPFQRLLLYFRLDPLHQRDEREHSPTGRLAVREDHQHQLGGCVQVAYHHSPPHGLWQRGKKLQERLSDPPPPITLFER